MATDDDQHNPVVKLGDISATLSRPKNSAEHVRSPHVRSPGSGCCGVSDWSKTLPMRVIGSLLNINAGYVNAVVFAQFDVGTTHVTGTATVAAVSLVNEDFSKFARLIGMLLLFMFGCFCCTLCIGGQQKFHPGPYYSIVLTAIATLLFAASFMGESMVACSFLVCVAAGMQNAMTTYFSGAQIRTTHLTGTVTDIGIELANLAAGRGAAGNWKLKLLSSFMTAFITGAVLGTAAAGLWALQALYFPTGLCLVLAVGAVADYYSVVKIPEPEVRELAHQLSTRQRRGVSVDSAGLFLGPGPAGAASPQPIVQGGGIRQTGDGSEMPAEQRQSRRPRSQSIGNQIIELTTIAPRDLSNTMFSMMLQHEVGENNQPQQYEGRALSSPV